MTTKECLFEIETMLRFMHLGMFPLPVKLY